MVHHPSQAILRLSALERLAIGLYQQCYGQGPAGIGCITISNTILPFLRKDFNPQRLALLEVGRWSGVAGAFVFFYFLDLSRMSSYAHYDEERKICTNRRNTTAISTFESDEAGPCQSEVSVEVERCRSVATSASLAQHVLYPYSIIIFDSVTQSRKERCSIWYQGRQWHKVRLQTVREWVMLRSKESTMGKRGYK